MVNIDLTYAVFFNLANAYHVNGMWKEAIQSYTPIVKNKQYPQGGRLRVNMVGNNDVYDGRMYSFSIEPHTLYIYK
jgi:intraflagellar transport protein 88